MTMDDGPYFALQKVYWHGTVDEYVASGRRCITTRVGRYVRRVYYNSDGKAVATGWFTKSV